jgi:hypothetical protein
LIRVHIELSEEHGNETLDIESKAPVGDVRATVLEWFTNLALAEVNER